MDILFSLLSFSIIASFTPGPNNILVMSQAISRGLRTTLPYQCGAGLLCFLTLSGLLLLGAEAGKYIPVLFPLMKYAGCAYLLYMAWGTLVGGPGEPLARRGPATFSTGMLMQFLNPKFYLYMLTLAGPLLPGISNCMEIALYALFFALVAVAGMFVWAASGAVLQQFLVRRQKAVNLVMSLALIYCAASLLLT